MILVEHGGFWVAEVAEVAGSFWKLPYFFVAGPAGDWEDVGFFVVCLLFLSLKKRGLLMGFSGKKGVGKSKKKNMPLLSLLLLLLFSDCLTLFFEKKKDSKASPSTFGLKRTNFCDH